MDASRPLRIAIVHASDLGGGAERSVISLHRALRAAGHESTVFVGERRTDEPWVEQIPYVRGMPGLRRAARALENRFGWQDIYNPSFRALTTRIAGNFDVVHFNSLWGSAGYADIGALPALTRSIPGVLTLREYWMLTGHCACFHDCMRWKVGCGDCPDLTLAPAIPYDGTRFNWSHKRRAIAASRLHVVTISDDLKRTVEASPIFAGKAVSRIYNGIDLDTFHPLSPSERIAARLEFGFRDSDVVVLLAGQTVEGIRHGIASRYAIDALNKLSDRPDVHALVIGQSAVQLSAELKNRSTVLPFQVSPSAMARCFQVADLCLVTSEVEAFGRIAAESQACGTPVVAFDSGGIPEVVRDGVGGLIVTRKDARALLAALERAVQNDHERLRMAVAGRQHVLNNFDQRAVANQYVQLYRRLAPEIRVRNA
jgi:glycosyltransferase involved in cell wall biosynthesis